MQTYNGWVAPHMQWLSSSVSRKMLGLLKVLLNRRRSALKPTPPAAWLSIQYTVPPERISPVLAASAGVSLKPRLAPEIIVLLKVTSPSKSPATVGHCSINSCGSTVALCRVRHPPPQERKEPDREGTQTETQERDRAGTQ